MPVLAAVAVLADGRKELLALELCGSESGGAWKGFVDDLQTRGLRAPLLTVIDGNPGLRQALGRAWLATAVQLRTTNVIEHLNEEFRRRVKTQSSLPAEDAALILRFSLVVSGQIKLRKIDGHAKMATVISKRLRSTA